MALMNSFVLNYFIRNKISANLNMFYLYELPIPNANTITKDKVIEKAFTLLYQKSNSEFYENLRIELGIEKQLLDDYIDVKSLVTNVPFMKKSLIVRCQDLYISTFCIYSINECFQL